MTDFDALFAKKPEESEVIVPPAVLPHIDQQGNVQMVTEEQAVIEQKVKNTLQSGKLLLVDPETNEQIGVMRIPLNFCVDPISCSIESGGNSKGAFSYRSVMGGALWVHSVCGRPTLQWWLGEFAKLHKLSPQAEKKLWQA